MAEQPVNLPAVRQQPKPSVLLAHPPVDIEQAWRAAGTLALTNLLPKGLYANNPETTRANVTLILWYGAELGLSPMQALQSIYVVEGRPQLSGQLWLAKVREASHKVTKGTHTAEECTITITRGDTGEAWTETFTIDDAKRAKLAGKPNWLNYPKRMLLWRAAADCARAICPEVALGFGDEAEADDAAAPAALAHAVDARTPPMEPVDAEIVTDGELQRELADIAAQHQSIADEYAANGDPLIDPDCLAGKCGSCSGPPCEHECHIQDGNGGQS